MNDETESVSLISLLDSLVEVPEPVPVSLFPQTWGWVVVTAIALVLLGWYVWRRVAHYRADAYRRVALAELDAAGDDPATIAAIVRRTALVAYPRHDVASLTGTDWLAFLDNHGQGVRFAEGQGRTLVVAPFDGTKEVPGLKALAREWVLRHEEWPA